MPNLPGLPNLPDLEQFPLFHGLPSALLESWKPRFTRQCFSKRQPLVFPSASSDVIYFVRSGKIKISYYSEDGKEFTVAILSAGEVYSEHSLALATTVEDTEVFYLSMADFNGMMGESPELAHRLIRVLGQLLRLTNDLIVDLAFREAASRLARVCWRAVQAENNHPTISHPISDSASPQFAQRSPSSSFSSRIYLTHEELASLSGTTRQTVNEILRRWERQGILAMRRGQIHILNLDRLREKLDK